MGTGLIRELVWDSGLNVPFNLLNVFGLIIVSNLAYKDFFYGLLPPNFDFNDMNVVIGLNPLEFGLAFVSVLIFFGALDRVNGILSFVYLNIRNNRIAKGVSRSRFNHPVKETLSAFVEKLTDYLVNHFAVTKEGKEGVRETFKNYDSIYYIQKLWFFVIMVAYILCSQYESYSVFKWLLTILIVMLLGFTCLVKVVIYELNEFSSTNPNTRDV